MRFKISVSQILEYGQRKDAAGNPHQEDSLFPGFGQATPNDRLFVLCDGMGGHDAGEVASATVCEAMSNSVLSSGLKPEDFFPDSLLLKAVDDAFNALDKRDTGATKKMGTTMTFLKLHKGGATLAHMGDSRIYHIRPGKNADDTEILHVTVDHSLVNDLIRIGELTVEEARVSPRKNVITRAMQPMCEYRPRVELFHITDIRPGDFFYMCSDGMLEITDDYEIRENFSDVYPTDEAKVQNLIRQTINNRDNHTAFLIHILDVEGQADIPANGWDIPKGAATIAMATNTQPTHAVELPVAEPAVPTPPGAQPIEAQPLETEPINTMPFRPQPSSQSTRRPAYAAAPKAAGKNRNTMYAIVALIAVIIICALALFVFGGKNDDKKDNKKATPIEQTGSDTPKVNKEQKEKSDAKKEVREDAQDEGNNVKDTFTEGVDDLTGDQEGSKEGDKSVDTSKNGSTGTPGQDQGNGGSTPQNKEEPTPGSNNKPNTVNDETIKIPGITSNTQISNTPRTLFGRPFHS